MACSEVATCYGSKYQKGYSENDFRKRPGRQNWQKGLDLTRTLCYSLCYDKSNTDINRDEFDHTYHRVNGGHIPAVIGESLSE